MKHLVLVVVLSMIPYGLRPLAAEPADGGAGDGERVIVVGDARVQVSGEPGTVIVEAGPEGYVYTATAAATAEDGRSDSGDSRVTRVRLERADGAEPGGWFGVSIERVPEPLAEQLDIGENGVLVVNVAKDSPADRAGVQAHDVILVVEGEQITGPSDAQDAIRRHKAGQNVEVILLRDGKEHSLNVTLGDRSQIDPGQVVWRFEATPDARIEEEIHTRGKMLFRGPEGEWVLKELGDLDELDELPDSIRMFMPEGGKRVMQFTRRHDKQNIKVKVERDGTVIVIEQEDGGPITVQRTDEDGRETVDTYADADELQEADEEAYKLYSRGGRAGRIYIDAEGIADLDDLGVDFQFDFDFDGGDWQEHAHKWQAELDESLGDARDAYRQAMEKLHQSMQKLHEEEGLAPLEALEGLDAGRLGGLHFLHERLGKPRYRFEVRPDGTIEARIRGGDSEIVRVFTDEDDLADRDPGLYDKFDRLMSADHE